MSKPQGLVRRGNVWRYRRRIPLDLVEHFGGKRELKESLGTSNLAKAKTLRNIVAAKFDAQFAAARTTSQVKPVADAHEISSAEALTRIRKYVAQEDAISADHYASTPWAENSGMRRSALNQTSALVERYKDPSDDVTFKAIVRAGGAIFDGADIQMLEENWAHLHRAVLELKRRELARLKADFRDPTSDHLFGGEIFEASRSPSPQSIALKELVDRYSIEFQKTKASVGDKRRAKVSSALDLLVRFFGATTSISQIDPLRCSEFRDLLNELPSNLRKHFPDSLSLEQIKIECANKRGLPIMAWDTQDHYLRSLKTLFGWARSKWLINDDPTLKLEPVGTKAPSKEARDPFTTTQLISIFNAPLYTGCRDDAEGYTG